MKTCQESNSNGHPGKRDRLLYIYAIFCTRKISFIIICVKYLASLFPHAPVVFWWFQPSAFTAFIRHIFGVLNWIKWNGELLPNIWNNINSEAGIVLLADLSACPTFLCQDFTNIWWGWLQWECVLCHIPFGFSFSWAVPMSSQKKKINKDSSFCHFLCQWIGCPNFWSQDSHHSFLQKSCIGKHQSPSRSHPSHLLENWYWETPSNVCSLYFRHLVPVKTMPKVNYRFCCMLILHLSLSYCLLWLNLYC